MCSLFKQELLLEQKLPKSLTQFDSFYVIKLAFDTDTGTYVTDVTFM